MPDNVTIPLTGNGDATAIVATDTIGGVAYQRTKVVWGVDGTATDVTATTPLPISAENPLDYDTGGGTVTQGLVGIALPASGGPVGVSATNPMPAKYAGYLNTSWAVHHLPAANTVATISQASAGGAIKNVCTGFTVTLAAGTSAPAAIQVSVALIDGSTGGGTYLWRSVLSLPAVAGAVSAFAFGKRWDVGSAATAMTLEFSAAGGANTIESVSMCGTTTL